MPKIRQDIKNIPTGQLLKVHLVFESITQELISEISRYCVITWIHKSIEEMSCWITENQGASPDVFLINCASKFSDSKKFASVKNKFVLLNRLNEINNSGLKSRVVLLIPEFMANDLSFLSALLKLRIYNLWFVDSFNVLDIKNFLTVDRTQEDFEKYIREKEEVLSLNKNSLFVKNKIDRIYRPYYVKSNVIAFWTPDQPLLNHAAAVLTAFKLAANGFKVALIEGISSIPRLACSLQLEHPYFNTRHALLMYSSNNTGFLKKCIFNADKYLEDAYSLQREEKFISQYPKELFFLPDCCLTGNYLSEDVGRYWGDFITSLIRMTIFEQNFNFLIFIIDGVNEQNDLILNELTNIKFLSIGIDPGSIVFAQNENKKRSGNIQIIASQQLEHNFLRLNELFEKPVIYSPSVIQKDYLNFIFYKNFRKISNETHEFTSLLAGHIGVNISCYKPMKETEGLLHKIVNYKPGR